VWDTKYRPLKFAEVLGQPGTVQLLKARLQKGTALDTSYLFEGGHGQGKTTLARIYARAMLCLNLDKADPEPCNKCENCLAILNDQPGPFSERDAASQGTIENIRSIVNELPFSVFNASKRVYLFDEAHRMGQGAQDVLLKPIEEKKMIAILCTTEPDKIRGTIRSRCEPYTIRKVTREDILGRMKLVLQQEGVEYQDDAVLVIIDHSGGHVRDILNKMEMISQLGPITVDGVREYLKLSVVSLFYEILLALRDPKKAIGFVDQACEQISPDAVAAGLAEAAMNSYRLANNMFADFVSADRELGKRVYGEYGPYVIHLADHFLKAKHVSEVSLVRDILVLSQWDGKTPIEPLGRPVLVPWGSAPATAPVASVPAPGEAASPAPASPAPAASAPAAPAPAPPPVKELTTPDLPPLGEMDVKLNMNAAPMPRMDARGHQHLVFPGKNVDEDDMKPLNADVWRREFERLWLNRGDASG